MKNDVKTFRLFVRPDKPGEKISSKEIANKIRTLNTQKKSPLVESKDADLVIAIGGDGTFIEAVTKTNFSKDIIYTGIHTGTLGFLQDLSESDVYNLIKYIDYQEELKTRKVYIAFVKVILKDGSSHEFFALNEAHIAGKDYSKIAFSQYVNGELLQNISASGIIIATSTGDTAMSLNAGGSVLNLSNDCKLVCTLNMPIINCANERFIPNSIICSKVTIDLKTAENICIHIDGQRKDIESSKIDKVEISMDDDLHYINKLDIFGFSKIQAIRNKILGY